MKVLSDATGFMSARGPYEMGGSYFAFNLVTSQASCWIAARLYVAHFAGENKIDSTTIYSFIAALQTLWALAVCAFFLKIKRKYWGTFYSTESGRQNAMAYFQDNKDDAARVGIFRRHTDLWSDIEKEVKAYTLENWEKWEKEKPEWFDDNFKASVPDEFIPTPSLEELKKKGGGVRRRSSAGLLLLQGKTRMRRRTTKLKEIIAI